MCWCGPSVLLTGTIIYPLAGGRSCCHSEEERREDDGEFHCRRFLYEYFPCLPCCGCDLAKRFYGLLVIVFVICWFGFYETMLLLMCETCFFDLQLSGEGCLRKIAIYRCQAANRNLFHSLRCVSVSYQS